MDTFEMNGYLWRVQIVKPSDPRLVDRTDTLTVATTDIYDQVVYLSNQLEGDFLMRVFLHELGHCALFSYHLLDDIHRITYPENWIEAEEMACNFIADYGFKIFSSAFKVLGYDAWKMIPKEFERRFAS